MKTKSVLFALILALAGCGQKTPAPKTPVQAEDAGPPAPPGATNKLARKLTGPPFPKVKLPTLTNAAKAFKLSVPESMVTLTWDASQDPSVNGYRLYQGPNSRQYTNSIPVTPATNNVVIVPVVPGSTNFYAVTAVATNGLESAYSNEVQYNAASNQNNFYIVVLLQASPTVGGAYTNFSAVVLTNPPAPQLFFKLQIVQTNSP